MPQTLGAFLAVLTVMMFALNYQQQSIITQRKIVSSELEVLANASASEVMQYVSTKSFDARIAANEVTPESNDPSGLTESSYFGGGVAYADAADIDDFHGVTHQMSYQLTPETELTFDVSISVKYVDDVGVESPWPTWTKEVSVRVDGPYGLLRPIFSTRQFSPLWY